MSKRTIIDWSRWGLAAVTPGVILLISSIGALAARDPAFDIGGDYGRAMVTLLVIGGVFATTGLVLELAAWWGAVQRTAARGHHEWHRALLWAGVAGILTTPFFGLGILLFGSVLTAYLVSGPDDPHADLMHTTPGKSLITRRANQGWLVAGAGVLLAVVVGNLTHPGLPFHGLVWPSLMLESAGVTLVVLGAIIIAAAWWGALFNAYLLPDRTWFRRLRWTGTAAALTMPLLGLGAIILAVTLTAWARGAPDGTAQRPTEQLTGSVLGHT
jgi:hypothetical protein